MTVFIPRRREMGVWLARWTATCFPTVVPCAYLKTGVSAVGDRVGLHHEESHRMVCY